MQISVSEACASHQFSVLQAGFEEAWKRQSHSYSETIFSFGRRSARFRIVGQNLAEEILRPFDHLRSIHSNSDPIHLTIDLWDENETEVRCQIGPTLEQDGWNQITAISTENRFIGQQTPNTLSCLDRKAQHLIGSIAWSDRMFIYERAKPLAKLLLYWYTDQQLQVLHGGLVSRNGQGILIAGKSGSGKSSSALACFCGGFGFLGEDYIGLQHLKNGEFVGHSIYNSVFLETDHLAQFPSLRPYILKGRLPHEKKSVVILSGIFPNRLERTTPIRALVLPRLSGQAIESRIGAASKGEALLALGPSSLLEIPSPSRGVKGFNTIAQLVQQIPCYWMELGTDLKSIPRLFEEMVADEGPVRNP